MGGGGGSGRLLSVPVFWTTDFCGEVPIRSHRGGWGLHYITLGTCGLRPSEAREREASALLLGPLWGLPVRLIVRVGGLLLKIFLYSCVPGLLPFQRPNVVQRRQMCVR